MAGQLLRLKAFPLLHELHTKSYRVWSQTTLSPSELKVLFKIEAAHPKEFLKIQLPDVVDRPARKSELWKHTCFELFIPAKDSNAYLEFNGSPSGDWNLYSFKGYREAMSEYSLSNELAPKLLVQSRGESSVETLWSLPLPAIRQGFLSAGVSSLQFESVGITVVLETSVATTYWALAHDGIKPDFHLKTSWKERLV